MRDSDKDIVRRIIIIDDNIDIHNDFRSILCENVNSTTMDELEEDIFGHDAKKEGPQYAYELDYASQGQEGFEKIRQAYSDNNPFILAFVDMRMPPGWDGLETIENIWEVDPSLHIVICSAYSDYSWEEIVKKLGNKDNLLILKKPFDIAEVCQLASALTGKCILAEQANTNMSQLEGMVADKTVALKKTNINLKAEIVERKQVEEKLKEYDRLKTEFVVNVSHELRTPLTIFKNIISNLQAGVAGSLNPKQHKNLEIADKEIDRLARIINDFLDISKIESGTINLESQHITVQSLVTDVVELFEPLAEEKNMELTTSMGDEELFIDADHDRMIQVLANLISNAIKFVPDVGGRIAVQVRGLDNEVSIAVEDNGRGIDTDDISRIFDRFVQVEKHVGPGSHGTGLGLAISKELVELQGGRIEVVSEEGCGSTTFTVFLPLVRECVAV